MKEQEKERIESEISSTEKEVSDYEDKISEINEKLETLGQTLENIRDDVSVSRIIETVEQQKEREKVDEERNTNNLRDELMGLLEELHEIQKDDLETQYVLNDLINIGENVSEALEVLQDREAWVMESKSKVIALLERLKSDSFSYLLSGGSLGAIDGKPQLSKTNQVYTNQILDGKEVLVFDTPLESVKNAVFRQGNAYPELMRGTCGLCSIATIMRKAGFDVDEKKIIDHAVKLKEDLDESFCEFDKGADENGGTDFINRSNLIKSMCGLEVTAEVTPLEEVAKMVENGHGVVIGVNASIYAPEWYGRYYPSKSAGHALVLDSVVRDKSSHQVMGYYVIDSNGQTSAQASRFVSAEQLSRAYNKHGTRANITKNIIW